jgi:hypothetical protein
MFLPRQTDLFEDHDDFSQMELRLGHLEDKFGNVQRGLFARHKKMEDVQAELFKMIIDLKEEMAKIRELMIKRKK